MGSRRPASSTGDLQNNLEKLRYELLRSKYTGPLDIRVLRKGSPADLLPLIHFSLLGYSKHVHDALVASGYDLFAKTDIRFMEAVYKLLRSEFDYQPQLRVDQFFCDGFVERKVIFVHDVLKLCQLRHIELKRGPASKRGGKPPAIRTAPTHAAAPLVERHGRSISVSSAGGDARTGRSVSISSSADNDAEMVPRPAAPTPLHASGLVGDDGVPPLFNVAGGAVPASILRERTLQHEVVIQGGGGGGGADEIEDEDYGEEDDWEHTQRVGGGVFVPQYDEGEEDEMFASREELAQRTQGQQGQQHPSGYVCHNDSLVLRMSESLLVLVGRVEELEDKVERLEQHAIASDDLTLIANKQREEAEAQLVLAEGRIRLLEQKFHEMACDAAVNRAFSPPQQQAWAGVQQSASPARHAPAARDHHNATLGTINTSGGSAARASPSASPQRGTRTSQDSPQRRKNQPSAYHTVEAPGHASASASVSVVSESRRSTHSAPSGAGGAGQDLEAFIASITNRFRETNELLSQSKETLKRRETPMSGSY